MIINSRVRWFGGLFLIVAAGQLIWGQTLLKPYLNGLIYVAYWLGCLLFTGLAMVMALLDMRSIRMRTREQHRQIVKKAFLDGSPSPDHEKAMPPQDRPSPPAL
jgi:hypothetical protein